MPVTATAAHGKQSDNHRKPFLGVSVLTPFSAFLEPISAVPKQSIQLTADWAQGRATYGGLVAALMLQGMQSHVDAERLLRSVQVTFVAPAAPQEAQLCVETLRVGGSVTLMSARLVQAGLVCATATASFGAPRVSTIHIPGVPRPEVVAPEQLRPTPYIPGVVPTFLQHLDMRWASGNLPLSGAKEPDFSGWLKFRELAARWSDVWMIGLLDAWPAGVLPMLSKPAPASSLSWAVDLVTPGEAVPPDGWWFYEVQTQGAADGYTQADARLWLPDGRLAAVSRQTSAVFG